MIYYLIHSFLQGHKRSITGSDEDNPTINNTKRIHLETPSPTDCNEENRVTIDTDISDESNTTELLWTTSMTSTISYRSASAESNSS